MIEDRVVWFRSLYLIHGETGGKRFLDSAREACRNGLEAGPAPCMEYKEYFYDAPWGLLLQVMTVVSILLLLGMVAIGIYQRPEDQKIWDLVMIVVPLLTMAIALLFTIRGYVLCRDALYVRRLGWSTRIDLAGLRQAEFDPEATRRTIRRFGNGGLFCFAGYFKSKKIGPFRAFATDLRRAVVLSFADRVIVVTPGDPLAFVERVRHLRGLSAATVPPASGPMKQEDRR